jgi:hypothetical protein
MQAVRPYLRRITPAQKLLGILAVISVVAFAVVGISYATDFLWARANLAPDSVWSHVRGGLKADWWMLVLSVFAPACMSKSARLGFKAFRQRKNYV